MVIVIVVDGLNLSKSGGVGTCIHDLSRGFLQSSKVSKLILVGAVQHDPGDPLLKQLIASGASVYSLGAKNRSEAIMRSFHYAYVLRQIIKSTSRVEQIVCNLHLKLGVLIGTMASVGLRNVKRIETYHNTYKNYWLQCTLLRPFIDRYICVSSSARKEMLQRFGIPENKVVTIENGVDRELLRASVSIIENNNEHRLRAITVGRLSYEKNMLIVAKAISSMSNSEVDYTIIGDGPQRSELESIIDGCTNIHYLGALDRVDVIEHVCNTDIVIIPSLWEGRSIFMLESAAFDKPFILSDCAGLREPFNEPELKETELLRVCKFGYLVKTNSQLAYVEALNHFVQHKYLRDSMSKEVKEFSFRSDVSNVVDRYLKEMDTVFGD